MTSWLPVSHELPTAPSKGTTDASSRPNPNVGFWSPSRQRPTRPGQRLPSHWTVTADIAVKCQSFKECTRQQQQQLKVGPRPLKRTWGYLEEDGSTIPMPSCCPTNSVGVWRELRTLIPIRKDHPLNLMLYWSTSWLMSNAVLHLFTDAITASVAGNLFSCLTLHKSVGNFYPHDFRNSGY